MELKYGILINKEIIEKDLKRLTNQIFKLLPEREENLDWQSPLDTIILELAGMHRLLIDQHEILFPLLCKLEGLSILTKPSDFYMFRRTIFECLGLINKVKESLCQD
ncbi:MAG: hypothetical protein [Caudoviricetes sp.]|nr:MAG: hypothetical protein [Caudoviricetes sp.]